MKTLQLERYRYRQLKQEPGESIDLFYRRLKDNIQRCGYTITEEENRLKEQIIDKCLSLKLREIALQVNLTLEDLIFTGKTIESDNKLKVNEVQPYVRRSFSQREERKECSRCGFFDHLSGDLKCPATKTRCNGCCKIGHFEKMCWETRFKMYNSLKRSNSDSTSDNRNNRSNYGNNCGNNHSTTRDHRNNYNTFNRSERLWSPDRYRKRVEVKIEPRSPDSGSRTPKERPRTPDEDFRRSKDYSKNSSPSTNSDDRTRSHTAAAVNLHEIAKMSTEKAKLPKEILNSSKVKTETIEGVTYYECLIGGMMTKLVVRNNYPTNVMSKETFKKLYNGKYKFFTTDFVPSKVGEFQFSGQFTSKIEISGQIQYISFYVQEGSDDFVIIGKKMAEQLKLPLTCPTQLLG